MLGRLPEGRRPRQSDPADQVRHRQRLRYGRHADAVRKPQVSEAAETERPAFQTYRKPLGNDWWLRRRSYFLYMVRESTVIFMVAWLVWFLYQVAALKLGRYEPPTRE